MGREPYCRQGSAVRLEGYRAGRRAPADHAGGEPLGLDLFEAAIEAESVSLRQGDILMLQTGWCQWFLALAPEEKQQIRDSRNVTGIAQSEGFLACAWDHQLRFLVADNFAFEFLPAVPSNGMSSSPSNC